MQIALLIILPLILYYQRAGLRPSRIMLYVTTIFGLWYVTYSPLHELRHLLPAVVLGERVIEVQLFPHFMQGELSGGHVTTQYSSDWSEFVIVLFPYLTDALLAIFGAVVLMKFVPRSQPLVFGLLLTILVTSPLFDVVNNYLAFVAGAQNDFNAISYTTHAALAHAIGILATAVTLGASSIVLWFVFRQPGSGDQASNLTPR
ncbi:hypothetical protein Mal64_26120 [Pseudobythopirellula maris]|uniref:Uncharacterized protein n=1 Tax=Pseudobythopirellula maris TaxID=2527991 RepID=A0A5C5ZPH4_9BACT|nr:hypothetical protein [Pseudobythopirellula maris]TWT89120.1 hypothetical protein Mal64_26120 [Pseudobythopirellula maris]